MNLYLSDKQLGIRNTKIWNHENCKPNYPTVTALQNEISGFRRNSLGGVFVVFYDTFGSDKNKIPEDVPSIFAVKKQHKGG